MKKFSNEAMNLQILAEEAAEVIQAHSKIVRFGMEDHFKKDDISNREKLEEEVGHIMAMVDVLVENSTLRIEHITKARIKKLEKMETWYFKTEDGMYNGHAVIGV